jgi:hypothetical protein
LERQNKESYDSDTPHAEKAYFFFKDKESYDSDTPRFFKDKESYLNCHRGFQGCRNFSFCSTLINRG